MKKIKLLIFLPLVGLTMTSCIGKRHYPEKDYFIVTPWSSHNDLTEDYRILQLSDIHLSQVDNHEEHFKVIDRTVKTANPDLIILNGDTFTYADKHTVHKVFSHIDSYHIPWSFTFGNHDDQGYYADNYIQRLLGGDLKQKYTNVLFKNLEDDDVTGRSNFVINIKDYSLVEKPVVYQVYLLDSNNYNFDTMGYDYVKQDQIDWYERMVKYSIANYASPKSSIYMHIGTPEFISSYHEENPEVIMGDMEEFLGSPKEDLGFFNKVKELGLSQSISVAHDHANDSVLKYQGVYLCYGVHSTNRVYNDDESKKIGGQVISIDKVTKELSFENIYTSYSSEEVLVVSSKGGQA